MSANLAEQIRQIISKTQPNPVTKRYLERLIGDSGLTRDENPYTHFCVYFAAIDKAAQQVFIGHHKKSGLWLFNGGHIDRDERLEEAVTREIGEEWGTDPSHIEVSRNPLLLTITEIDNTSKRKCTRHYDIWYFVSVDKNSFMPDQLLLEKEFFDTRWCDIGDARNLISDPSTLEAIGVIERLFRKSEGGIFSSSL